MRQILHILRKDGRRHWPEILTSLVLLGLFTHLYLHPWQNSSYSFFFGRPLSLRGTITPVLILFWCFLILRVIHSENLIGDRQWWMTKPYVWWKLLIAKLLFVLLVICVPLFLIQLYFLHYHGFPVFRNVSAVFGSQIGLALVLFLPGLVLAALTKSLGQAFLTVVGIFLALLALSWLTNGFSGGKMAGPSRLSDATQFVVYSLCITGVLLWQFAYRRTWQARGIVCLCVVFVVVIANIASDEKYVENEYPLVEGDRAPAIVSLRSFNLHAVGIWPELLSDMPLQIPLKISGIAEKSVVLFQGMKLTLTTPDGVAWTRGWRTVYSDAWPEDERHDVSYEMKRKDYERLKNSSVRVQIELALSQYVEDQPRVLVLSTAPFSDEKLGTCRINPPSASYLECLKPFASPGFIASFDAQQSACASDDNPSKANIQHSWSYPNEHDFAEPGISPITDYSIYFRSGVPLVSSDKFSEGTKHPQRLCSGTKIEIADPKLKQRFRVKLDAPKVGLMDMAAGSYRLD